MSLITAQSIIDRSAVILHDDTNVRWPDEELLKWLNDGQREVVLHKPDANPINESVQLAAGSKQSIPATGIQLIDVSRNMGTDGTTPGNAVTFLSRNILDNSIRTWHTLLQQATIEHYCFDDRDPKHWYCYPPADGTGYVEEIYSAAPADIPITAVITIDDIYANALLDYILYRAYSKDAEFMANQQRAAGAYATFLRSLGIKDQVEQVYDPSKQLENVIANTTQAK